MTRRNLISGGLFGLLALCGWRATESDEPPPYRVMKVTYAVVGKTQSSCPKGGAVNVTIYDTAFGKPTGEVRTARCEWVPLMPNQWVALYGDTIVAAQS